MRHVPYYARCVAHLQGYPRDNRVDHGPQPAIERPEALLAPDGGRNVKRSRIHPTGNVPRLQACLDRVGLRHGLRCASLWGNAARYVAAWLLRAQPHRVHEHSLDEPRAPSRNGLLPVHGARLCRAASAWAPMPRSDSARRGFTNGGMRCAALVTKAGLALPRVGPRLTPMAPFGASAYACDQALPLDAIAQHRRDLRVQTLQRRAARRKHVQHSLYLSMWQGRALVQGRPLVPLHGVRRVLPTSGRRLWDMAYPAAAAQCHGAVA